MATLVITVGILVALPHIGQTAVTTLRPTSTEPSTTTLLVTGDVLTARSVNTIATRQQDFTWPFAKTADQLRAADITFINLETPLIENCPLTDSGMIFCGDLRHVEGLTFAGIDVVNLANNHMGNHGLGGVNQTVAALNQAGLKVTGIDGPTYVKHGTTTFAFLGFNEVDRQVGVAAADDDHIVVQLAEARQRADVVVIQFHWGAEYRREPTTNQVRLAHLAIDNGADLVVGNHPHWWQPSEIYKGKTISYSMGNFIFDQMWSEETREGLVGLYTFEGNNLIKTQMLPIKIDNYGQPRWLEGEEKERVLKEYNDALRNS